MYIYICVPSYFSSVNKLAAKFVTQRVSDTAWQERQLEVSPWLSACHPSVSQAQAKVEQYRTAPGNHPPTSQQHEKGQTGGKC